MPEANRLTPEEIARARTRWDVITADLAMKRVGREFVGLCPFHNEKTPSFRVAPDKGYLHCFGCGAHGDVIDYIMRAHSVDFAGAVHLLNGTAPRPPTKHPAPRPRTEPARPDDNRQEYVTKVLNQCTPVNRDTPAHLYLWSRGLASAAPHVAGWRSNLLAHAGLYCAEVDQRLPALVAPIEGTTGVTACQRIWVQTSLIFDGVTDPKDSRARLGVRKKTVGAMLDGAVRLRPARRLLGIAEGVETAIAAGLVHNLPVWATCGAGRMGSIALPEIVEEICIFGDNGATGEDLANRAASEYKRRGLKATVCFPPVPCDDFNAELIRLESNKSLCGA